MGAIGSNPLQNSDSGQIATELLPRGPQRSKRCYRARFSLRMRNSMLASRLAQR
jgi:hypothetical protein